MEEGNSSDEEFQEEGIIDHSNEDLAIFYSKYEGMKKGYISKPFLTKFEKTKIISERSQQLSNGAVSFLKNPGCKNAWEEKEPKIFKAEFPQKAHTK